MWAKTTANAPASRCPRGLAIVDAIPEDVMRYLDEVADIIPRETGFAGPCASSIESLYSCPGKHHRSPHRSTALGKWQAPIAGVLTIRPPCSRLPHHGVGQQRLTVHGSPLPPYASARNNRRCPATNIAAAVVQRDRQAIMPWYQNSTSSLSAHPRIFVLVKVRGSSRNGHRPL